MYMYVSHYKKKELAEGGLLLTKSHCGQARYKEKPLKTRNINHFLLFGGFERKMSKTT